jgi:hypothetical protein
MEWVLKLEAKSGWGEVETIEVGKLERRVVGLTAEEVGGIIAGSGGTGHAAGAPGEMAMSKPSLRTSDLQR